MLLVGLLLLRLLDADAAPPQTCAVTGTIKSLAGQSLPEMVVFLEPTHMSQTFKVPAPAEISQKGATFSPALLVICVGQTVLFKNDEDRPVEHNVFSRSPVKLFDLGLFMPPEHKPVTFDKPGVVRLFCSIHRYMDGVIYVCPTPFFATVKTDGSFAIKNVPAGNWVLKTWQKKARFDEQSVNVALEPDKPVTVNLEMSRK